MTDDRATKLATAAAHAVGASRPKRKRLTWRRLVLVGLLLLGAGYYIVRRARPVSADDGFVAFVPDPSMFPAAPVSDAQTVAGVGRPLGWPRDRDFCGDDSSNSLGEQEFGDRAGLVGTGWHTVRHDWGDDDDAKAWIVSERTFGYTDGDKYDEEVRRFVDQTKYCGWEFDGTLFAGFNSILTELDGLPDGAVAFTVGVSPEGDIDDEFDGSAPEDFHALAAFVPGPRRGLGMNVMWVGWGTEVPSDEFVAAVNTLYEAARAAPDDEGDSGNDQTIDADEFTNLDVERAGIIPLIGSADVQRHTNWLASQECGRGFPDARIWDGSVDEWGQLVSEFQNDARSASIGAGRWRERSRYLEAKELAIDRAAPLCIGSYQSSSVLIEPIDVNGLPGGAVVSRWNIESGSYAAVVFDDAKQTMMTVTWTEHDGPVPEDKFVEVVNRAWDQFQADNP